MEQDLMTEQIRLEERMVKLGSGKFKDAFEKWTGKGRATETHSVN